MLHLFALLRAKSNNDFSLIACRGTRIEYTQREAAREMSPKHVLCDVCRVHIGPSRNGHIEYAITQSSQFSMSLFSI